ncbi:MAG: DUF4231 domain-containing protein [Deltaproteobacteria bacterium]|nr:DUF4231 domain-containing protein [Deltaproteobacteria bacterium]
MESLNKSATLSGEAALAASVELSERDSHIHWQQSLARLEQAHGERDEAARESQRRRLTFARATALLGPVAVLFLAVQIKLAPEGGVVVEHGRQITAAASNTRTAEGLILAELAVLLVALVIPLLRIGQSHERWINNRMRAELLRREIFLLQARVGPYLNIRENALANRVEERLVTLDADLGDPVELLPMSFGSESWRDALEDAHRTATPASMNELTAFFNGYLYDRIIDQKVWFKDKSIRHQRHARLFEATTLIILIAALAVAAFHLGLISYRQPETTATKCLIILAIVLPAVGAALVGLLSILGCRRLSHSYAHHALALEHVEARFKALATEMATGMLSAEIVELRFRRLLLETEEILSNELRLWWLFMHLESPRASI